MLGRQRAQVGVHGLQGVVGDGVGEVGRIQLEITSSKRRDGMLSAGPVPPRRRADRSGKSSSPPTQVGDDHVVQEVRLADFGFADDVHMPTLGVGGKVGTGCPVAMLMPSSCMGWHPARLVVS